MTNTTLSAAYSFLRLSNVNRKLILTLATLENGAQIVGKLPRLNDTTRRLDVGFRKNKFSTLIHWTGTASAYASDTASTEEQLKYVTLEARAI